MGTTQLTKFRNLALLRFQKPCLAEIPEGAAHRGSGKFQLFANGGNRRPALSILIGTVRKVNIDRYRTVRRIHVVQRIKHKKAPSRKTVWWLCLLMMYHRRLLDFISAFFAFR